MQKKGPCSQTVPDSSCTKHFNFATQKVWKQNYPAFALIMFNCHGLKKLCFCGSMDLTLVLHVCWFFALQVWLQSEFWRKNIKTCWVRRISEPKTLYDIPGKKANLIQGSKGTLEYETCIIQDFSWIRIFQIDSRIVLIKAYNM